MAQVNRVPEPYGQDFVVMTPLRTERLRTNVDAYEDASFQGLVVGTTLTATSVDISPIQVGATLFGPTVTGAPTIQQQASGAPGGVGTYVIDVPQTVSPGPLAAGVKQVELGARFVVQLDFHSVSDSDSSDMAQTTSALFRDEYATTWFTSQGWPYEIAPLHADDPRQVPFLNDSQQYEFRNSLDVHLQANQRVGVPQQFAETLDVVTVSVDATYPPTN